MAKNDISEFEQALAKLLTLPFQKRPKEFIDKDGRLSLYRWALTHFPDHFKNGILSFKQITFSSSWNLQSLRIIDSDFEQAQFDNSGFVDCDFSRATFTNTTFTIKFVNILNSNFHQSSFNDSQFLNDNKILTPSLVIKDSSFTSMTAEKLISHREIFFEDTDLIKSHLHNSTFADRIAFLNCNLKNTIFSQTSFADLTVDGPTQATKKEMTKFTACHIKSLIYIRQKEIGYMDFSNSVFDHATIACETLHDCIFTRTTWTKTLFLKAKKVQACNFDNMVASNIQVYDCQFDYACSFVKSQISHSTFSMSTLAGNFQGARWKNNKIHTYNNGIGLDLKFSRSLANTHFINSTLSAIMLDMDSLSNTTSLANSELLCTSSSTWADSFWNSCEEGGTLPECLQHRGVNLTGTRITGDCKQPQPTSSSNDTLSDTIVLLAIGGGVLGLILIFLYIKHNRQNNSSNNQSLLPQYSRIPGADDDSELVVSMSAQNFSFGGLTLSMRRYKQSFENKKQKNSAVFAGDKALNESELNILCAITKTVPNIPVRLDGRVYDFDALIQLPIDENGKRTDPFTKDLFGLNEIQAARDLQEKIEDFIAKSKNKKEEQVQEIKTNPS